MWTVLAFVFTFLVVAVFFFILGAMVGAGTMFNMLLEDTDSNTVGENNQPHGDKPSILNLGKKTNAKKKKDVTP